MEWIQVWVDDCLVAAQPQLVGELQADNPRGRVTVSFRYANEWLAETGPGFAIDPELPLGPGDFFVPSPRTLHGVLRDTAPDRWGRRLMDRRERDEAASQSRRPRTLSDWDYLLGVQDQSRLGALRLRDPDSGRWLDDRIPGIPPITRLRELEAAASRLEADPTADLDPAISSQLQPGSSLGGTRPKATFRDSDGSLWIAKFPSRDDRIDVAGAEFLLHQLTSACGIHVPPARLESLAGRGRTFCVQRFDRQDSQRRLYWSAMTLLGRADGEDASYLDIAEARDIPPGSPIHMVLRGTRKPHHQESLSLGPGGPKRLKVDRATLHEHPADKAFTGSMHLERSIGVRSDRTLILPGLNGQEAI